MLDNIYAIQSGLAELTPAGLFFALVVGTFISEDAACLAAGTLVSAGHVTFGFSVAACFVGIFIGDMGLYIIGRMLGKNLFESRFSRRLVSDDRRERATEWLNANGYLAVFTSRFVSGLRLPTYLAAGALKTNMAKFSLMFLIASAIWTPLLVGSAALSQSFVFGKSLLIGFAVLIVFVRLCFRYTNWNNRRLLVGRIKRITYWEFWPLSAFYLPIIFYIIVLSVRYRSLTLFTAVNPSIPSGGFVGESKDHIYRLIDRSKKAAEHMLSRVLISAASDPEERRRTAVEFIDSHRLSFPLVLKPDAGERGKGVTIIRDRSELSEHLANLDRDHILQEYRDGVEASIFYYRQPNDEHGRIFSITEKVFPSVTGDGVKTLETLIFRNERAVCMAKHYFKANKERLQTIPAKGEIIRLIDIGTHSRGAVFREGNWLLTDRLESAIDEICRGIEGFHFGRFDIRASSFEDLKLARGFKIIELNGVTSESTNIYDPRYSIVDANRILFRQWKLAFEIGAQNRNRGVRPDSIWRLSKLILHHMFPRFQRFDHRVNKHEPVTTSCA